MTGRIKAFFMTGDKRSLTVKRNIAGSLMVKGLSIAVQFLLVPLTLGYLDKEIYGIWLTASSILTWFGFFDIGFTLGLRNRLAEALAHGDYEKGKELVSTTYGMMIMIFVPFGILACGLSPLIDWSGFFNVSKEFDGMLKEVMAVLFCSFALQMILGTITAVITAFQKTALASGVNVAGNVASLAVIWVLTKTLGTGSMLSLALAISFIPPLVALVCSVWLFRTATGRAVRPSVRYFRRERVRDLFTLGSKFFIIQLSLVVLYQSANILISNVAGPDEVTNYNIAYRYIFCGAMVFQIFLSPYWPAFTEAYAKQDYEWMQRSYRNLTKVYYGVVCGVLVMVAASPIVYRIWVGADVTVPMTMTMAVGVFTILNSWVQIQTILINGIGDIKLQTVVTTIGIFCQIPLALLLGRTLGLGAEGVVYSMSVINVIYCCCFTWQLRRLIGLSKQSVNK